VALGLAPTLEAYEDLIVAFHWKDAQGKHCETYQETTLQGAIEQFLTKHADLAVPCSFEVRIDRP
jgi:hypothetical protein